MYNDDEKYKRAKKRLEDVKDFYGHLIAYIVVNIILFVINLKVAGDWWFYWISIFWGIGLIFHFLEVFFLEKKIFGKKWEEKKIRQYMEDDK